MVEDGELDLEKLKIRFLHAFKKANQTLTHPVGFGVNSLNLLSRNLTPSSLSPEAIYYLEKSSSMREPAGGSCL